MSMEQRMTVCNMSIEGGARAGLIAPDEKTFEYLRGGRFTPDNYEELVRGWRDELKGDPNAGFDRSYTLDAGTVVPQVSWGTNPAMTCDVTGSVPHPDDAAAPPGDESARQGVKRALEYMDLAPGTAHHRHQDRQGVHRLVHQRQAGGSQGCGPRRPGEAGVPRRQGDGWSRAPRW